MTGADAPSERRADPGTARLLYNEKVDLELDGEAQERPITVFS